MKIISFLGNSVTVELESGLQISIHDGEMTRVELGFERDTFIRVGRLINRSAMTEFVRQFTGDTANSPQAQVTGQVVLGKDFFDKIATQE